MVRALNIALGTLLLGILGLLVSLRGPRVLPNREYFPNMVRTARYNAFEPNEHFPDGVTLRSPVPGTIPRGLPPVRRPDEGTEDLMNPFSADDRAALERGGVVFRSFCVPCHGTDGLGDGIIVEHGFPRPPTLLRARTLQMTDAQIFRIVTNGLGAMASYAPQISRDDRWKAILYVRMLQGRGTAETPAPDAR